jgi:hypothetical protein
MKRKKPLRKKLRQRSPARRAGSPRLEGAGDIICPLFFVRYRCWKKGESWKRTSGRVI